MSITVEHLGFAYRKQIPVLKNIGFRAEPGRLVAILGRNGSGKTTLLKMLNRLLKPDSGRVVIDGDDISGLSHAEIARRVAYMPQTQEAVHCTVFEAVLLGRKARRAGACDADDLRRVEQILDMVRVSHLAMRSTRELSGGELQKVVLGRALAQEPQVLLLDEPISHLDPVNQIEVMSLLHEVTRGLQMTSLLVTHDLNSAIRFADRFILLADGCIEKAGGREILTPEAVRRMYGIDSVIADVAGVPVLVPFVHGRIPHEHVHIHEHVHRGADGQTYTHRHPHIHQHTHEVDDHVYDHRHGEHAGPHDH